MWLFEKGVDFVEYCLVLHSLDNLERAQLSDFQAKGGKIAYFMREDQASVFSTTEIKFRYF